MNSSHRRSGSRSVVALVAGLALTAGLSACGDDTTDDTATDPSASSGTSDSSSPSESTPPPDSGSGGRQTIRATGGAGVTEATVVSATEGGGSASTLAFALDSDRAVADFTADLEGGLPDAVASVVSELRTAGSTPYGATAAIGCEPPRSVAVEGGEAGFEVVPQLPTSNVQCLAPVTYVVLFAVPDA